MIRIVAAATGVGLMLLVCRRHRLKLREADRHWAALMARRARDRGIWDPAIGGELIAATEPRELAGLGEEGR